MLQVQGAKAIQRRCPARSPRSVIFRIQDLPYRARGDTLVRDVKQVCVVDLEASAERQEHLW
jgi:hypothetical protein